MDHKHLIKTILSLSDRELDPIAKKLISEMSDPPLAIQILKVLDACVNGSLCGSVVIMALESMLTDACAYEKTTYQDVVKQAVWRTS